MKTLLLTVLFLLLAARLTMACPLHNGEGLGKGELVASSGQAEE